MLNYSKQTKIIASAVLIALVVLLVVVVSTNRSRSRDLQKVTQAKLLATSLEKYFDKFHVYPKSEKILVDQIKFISEQGINQTGKVLYYEKDYKWPDTAIYISDGGEYRLDFELENSWPIWGIDTGGGGKCRIVTNVSMKCIDQ